MAQKPTIPASTYGAVPTGPSFQHSYEVQTGVPVSGADPLLRLYSPFTLRFVLPKVLQGYMQEVQSKNPNIYTNGRASVAGNYRATQLAQSGNLVSPNFPVASPALTRRLGQVVANGRLTANTGNSLNEPMVMGKAQVADLVLQAQALLEVPPLTLLVNPQSLQISYTKVQNNTSRTRNGFVFEAWGEEQPKLSIAASTGGFYAGSRSSAGQSALTGQVSTKTASVSGLQYFSKMDSAAWQTFMQLYLMYKNNGYLFDRISGTEAHMFIGSIAIDYDQVTYMGHLETFSWEYNADSPHQVQGFSMEFTVSEMHDTAGQTQVVLPMLNAANKADLSLFGSGSSTVQSTTPEVAYTPLDFPAR